MRLLISILTIFIISSCQSDKEKIVEGDLYFKLFDIERFYDAPDSTLSNIEDLVREINKDTVDDKRKEV